MSSSNSLSLSRALPPVAVAIGLALLPPPSGLAPNAWHFFALFAGVVTALVLEPLDVAAIGVIAITLTALLAPWTLFTAEEMAKPGFNAASAAAKWAFTGFGDSTVWLVAGAFMFALAYKQTGLGRRLALWLVRALGSNTITLAYAVALADIALAPFTPSNTARAAGTMYPIVSQIPPLYKSEPNSPTAGRIGSYILWVTYASDCVVSALFMTACAPNFMARDFIKKIADVDLTYPQWFFAAAPFAIPLLIAIPFLTYLVQRPSVTKSPEVTVWANEELEKMGPLSRNEMILAASVSFAIIAWIFGGSLVNPAIVALAVICVLMMTGALNWKDIAGNEPTWTTIVLLATLVAMADGLAHTGFVKWFADSIKGHLVGYTATQVIFALVTIYFLSHYFFSSLTSHTAALMPIILSVGLAVPDMPKTTLAMSLAMTTGLMGIVSPYASGAALPYYRSGYFTSAQYWRNAVLFGLIFLAALLLIGIPVFMARGG